MAERHVAPSDTNLLIQNSLQMLKEIHSVQERIEELRELISELEEQLRDSRRYEDFR